MIRIANTPTGPARDLSLDEATKVIALYITETEYIYFNAGDESTFEWSEYLRSITPVKNNGESSANQIARYREVANSLIYDVNVLNSSAGLTTSQSVEIEATFDAVYRAIERGYFPLALLRIGDLPDTGIVYEGVDLRIHWKDMISSYLDEYKITI